MKRFFGQLAVLILIMGASTGLKAAEFQPVGYEAISMGGAGVAASKGSYAPYYNPALLARPRHGVEVTLGVGMGFRESNLVDHVDTLSKIDIDQTIQRVSNLNLSNLSGISLTGVPSVTINDPQLSSDVATIKKELRALTQKNGLELMPNAVLACQAGNFGFGLYALGEATAFAVIDPNRLEVIAKKNVSGTDFYVKYDEVTSTVTLSSLGEYQASSLDYAVNNKTTYMALTGMVYSEIPLAYGMTIPSVPGTFSMGGSLKIMNAQTYHSVIDVDTQSSEIQSQLKNSKETSATVGADLGILYSPPNMNRLSLGLVGKNLNKPKFKTQNGPDITIDPQVRAGAAYDLNDMVSLAFDMDLTTNKSYIEGYDTQFAGGGVSFHPASWFSLRGGLMKNLKESNEGMVFTTGIGLGIKWFQFDLAGEVSSKKGEYDGNTIPRYARVQMSLVSKWN